MCQGTTSQVAEKLIALKGHGFSRAVSGVESTRALAPEGRFSANSPPVPRFSAACSVVPEEQQNHFGL
jgi:hypothetical protein